MIEAYFLDLEQIIQEFPNVRFVSLTKKTYNATQGYIGYDNAPHHVEIATFPHHKHEVDDIRASNEPTLYDVLLEVAQRQRRLE